MDYLAYVISTKIHVHIQTLPFYLLTKHDIVGRKSRMDSMHFFYMWSGYKDETDAYSNCVITDSMSTYNFILA